MKQIDYLNGQKYLNEKLLKHENRLLTTGHNEYL